MRQQSRGWYILLLLPFLYSAFAADVRSANVASRYMLALPGALGGAVVFMRRARELEGPAKRLARVVALGFALYALAAGVIVPETSWWPADKLNQEWFSHFVGVPIQFVRGVLACWIALGVWGIWKYRHAAEISSERYTLHVRRMSGALLFSATFILGAGWLLTQYLGDIRTRSLDRESLTDMNLLASRFNSEFARLDKTAQALAASPWVLPLVRQSSQSERGLATALLDIGVTGSEADAGFILDRSGRLIAGSRGVSADDLRVTAYRHTRSFREALAGKRGHDILPDPTRRGQDFYASYPVYAAGTEVAAVAVLEQTVDLFAPELTGSDLQFFLVDSAGLIVMSNRSGSLQQSLWGSATAPGPGGARRPPLLAREIAVSAWADLDGERRYMRRAVIVHDNWSIVLAMPAAGLFASRFLGIIVTLLVTIMVLVYLYGQDRAIRDQIDLERRLKLQQLALDLQARTITDPLTGMNNRIKFDEELKEAIERGARYDMPFSLILYDVDHFKRINDNHGHLVGDHVLVGLSTLVSSSIRAPDLLARWGGEEFAILNYGADIHSARVLAERLRVQIMATRFPPVSQVTCSFGVARYVAGDSARSLLLRADQALYLAKARGRNRVELVVEEPAKSNENRFFG